MGGLPLSVKICRRGGWGDKEEVGGGSGRRGVSEGSGQDAK